MCANDDYMALVYKQMYEVNPYQATSERTWYPEMEDVRDRIGTYKVKNPKGNMNLKVEGIKH